MLKNKKGQGMVEYVLIIALIALVVILFIPGVTTAIGNTFATIAANL